MATTKTVRNDLIPAKAGCVRITPYKTDGTLDSAKAYTTKRNYLTSTQVTITRTSETLPPMLLLKADPSNALSFH